MATVSARPGWADKFPFFLFAIKQSSGCCILDQSDSLALIKPTNKYIVLVH